MKNRLLGLMPYLPLVGYLLLFVMSISSNSYKGWRDDTLVKRSIGIHMASWAAAFMIYYAVKFGLV